MKFVVRSVTWIRRGSVNKSIPLWVTRGFNGWDTSADGSEAHRFETLKEAVARCSVRNADGPVQRRGTWQVVLRAPRERCRQCS